MFFNKTPKKISKRTLQIYLSDMELQARVREVNVDTQKILLDRIKLKFEQIHKEFKVFSTRKFFQNDEIKNPKINFKFSCTLFFYLKRVKGQLFL